MSPIRAALRHVIEPLRDHPTLFVAIRDIFHPRASLYRHLHFRGPVVIDVGDGARFSINHHGYQIENELFWAGFGSSCYEGVELRIWRALARGAEFIADVGANTGVYCLTAAAVSPKARIVAFEPVPRIYEKLCANIALNAFDIHALQIAVSDSDGEATLFDTQDEHNYSASLDATMLEGLSTSQISVRAARLDGLLDELGWPQIDLLKIDVEKHEPSVLTGFARRLHQDRPTMVIEILNTDVGKAVVAQLDGLDYRCFGIGGEQGLTETQEFAGAEGRNYLFISSAAWASAEGRIEAEIASVD